MAKIGFINDIVRGIKKVIVKDEPKTATVKTSAASYGANATTAPLLKRAFMFLDDGDWASADEYCEKVLDQDPENAQAYLGKLMAELQVRRKEHLQSCRTSFKRNRYYDKAIRFADASLAAELKGYVTFINDRNARQAKEERKAAEEARKANDYKAAVNGYDSSNIDLLKKSHQIFLNLDGYKDSSNYAYLCQQKIDTIKIQEENDRRERERRQRILNAKNRELEPLIRTKSDVSIKLQNVENLEKKINSTRYEIDNFKLFGSAGQKSRSKRIIRQAVFTMLQFVSLIAYVIGMAITYTTANSIEDAMGVIIFIPLMLVGFVGGVISTGLLAKAEGEAHPIFWGIAAYMTFGVAGIVYMVKSVKKLFRSVNAEGKTKNELQLDLAAYEKQLAAFGPNPAFSLRKALDDVESEIRICNAKYEAMLNES